MIHGMTHGWKHSWRRHTIPKIKHCITLSWFGYYGIINICKIWIHCQSMWHRINNTRIICKYLKCKDLFNCVRLMKYKPYPFPIWRTETPHYSWPESSEILRISQCKGPPDYEVVSPELPGSLSSVDNGRLHPTSKETYHFITVKLWRGDTKKFRHPERCPLIRGFTLLVNISLYTNRSSHRSSINKNESISQIQHLLMLLRNELVLVIVYIDTWGALYICMQYQRHKT